MSFKTSPTDEQPFDRESNVELAVGGLIAVATAGTLLSLWVLGM
jgi:hypothetical protein